MAESQILRLGCNGLVSDPGPFSGVPDGAMVEAQNVMFRRPGVAESRSAFSFTQDLSTVTGTCRGVATFDDGSTQATHYVGIDYAAAPIWRKNGTTTIGGGFSFANRMQHAAWRGRGFFTADQGVAVLDTNSDTTARLAGVPRGPGFLAFLTTGTGAWLAADYVIGYRVCVVRSLNGIQSRGTPSEVKYLANNSVQFASALTYPAVRMYLSPDIVAGDSLELYRLSKVQGVLTGTYYTVGTPADEGRLRNVFVVTSSDISTGYIDFVDLLPDENFDGPYLYTNASQEGLLLGNERPNYARDVDVYNGMMFYAGQRSPHRVTLQLNGTGIPEDLGAPPPFTNGTDLVRRLCGYVCNGAITTGVNTITVTVADTAFITVGMRVTDGNAATVDPETGTANLPANVYVTNVNTATGVLTLSANATGTVGVAYLRFYDWIEVDDGVTKRKLYTCYGYSYPEPVANIGSTFTNFFVGTSQWHEIVSAGYCYPGGSTDIERAWVASYPTASFIVSAVAAGTRSNETITIRIERTDASLGSFTVRSSKPLAFDQNVDYTTGITSAQEGTPGRLAWSKIDQPEAVPLPYYADVGDPNQPIHMCVATQDALYVLKADGIYRVFGDVPESLVIQQVDPTARVLPYAATRYGNSVYAWTALGIIEVGNFGIRKLDAPIYKTANGPLGPLMTADNAWAVASQVDRWIAFGCQKSGVQYVWAFAVELGQWSSWTFRRNIVAACSVSGGTTSGNAYPVLGVNGGYGLYMPQDTVDTATANTYAGGDNITVDVTGTVGDTTIQIGTSYLYTPAVGDAILAGSTVLYVTQVDSPTQFVVSGAGISNGTYTVSEAYESRVTWTASASGNPAMEKAFIASWLLFSRLRYGRTMTERYSGYRNPTVVTNSVSYDPSDTLFLSAKPYKRIGHVPYGPGRDWALKFGFSQTQGNAFFTLDGGALSYNVTGTRL